MNIKNNKFRLLLKKNDIHIAQLARKLGVSGATPTRWGCGIIPKRKYFPALKKILNLTDKELVELFK